MMANGAAGVAMLTTHIAATAGALVWMAVEWLRFGRPTLLGVVTGMIAGLGIISPGAGFVGPLGALLLGIVAGVVCFFAIHWIKRTLNIDDALDVFPVHGVGGMIGSLFTAPLALESMGGSGLPTGHGVWEQMGLQALAVLVALAWSGGISILVLKFIDHLHGLRVGPDDETEGLDLSSHNGKGYHL